MEDTDSDNGQQQARVLDHLNGRLPVATPELVAHGEYENGWRESHAIDDLGIDSLDFLDIAFAIDKAFGIKLPLEKWTQEVNDGKATTEQYFVLKNLSARIDELVAAKGA